MTPRGPRQKTADGHAAGQDHKIIELMRYGATGSGPVKRVMIPKKEREVQAPRAAGWSDKLVGEVNAPPAGSVYEPRFSDRSHGSSPERAAIPRCARWPIPGLARPG